MKRIGNLYSKIYDMNNLILADKKARMGKLHQIEIVEHSKDSENNLKYLQNLLISKKYKTSKYYNFVINESKERKISKLPYFPDRICHHAILNMLAPIFINSFTKDTYSCIPKRGIHKASYNLRKSLRERERATNSCTQVRHF